MRSWKNRIKTDSERRADIGYMAAIVILIALFLMILQKFHPYFFLQDDNRDQYLPYFVHNFRAILHGDIAFFNFHQYLGVTHLANGHAAALYPLSWIAVLISKGITGDYFAAIDIVVSLHLIIGAAGFFRMLQVLGLDRPGAMFGAITWPLASYFFYVGNSWYSVTGPVAFLPWMIYFSRKLFEKDSGRHRMKVFLLLVLSRTLLFLIGHPQFFLYALIFEILLIQSLLIKDLFFEKDRDKKRAIGQAIRERNPVYLLSLLTTFLFSMPLLLPMVQQVNQSVRSEVLSREMFLSGGTVMSLWWKGLTDPYYGHVFQSISFVGISCLIFCAVGLLFILIRPFLRKVDWVAPHTQTMVVLSILGVFAFMWAGNILVSEIVYRIPVLNQFRWHYKLLIQFYLFFVAIGSFGVHLFTRFVKIRIETTRGSRFGEGICHALVYTLIAIQLIQFGHLYFYHPVRAIRIHREEVPWSEPLAEELKEGRILSVGFDYTSEYTAHTLAFNYATLWGYSHFAGYDVLLPRKNKQLTYGTGAYSGYFDDFGMRKNTLHENLDRFREWGVRWYIINPQYIELYGEPPFQKIATEEKRIIYKDSFAAPLVYFERSAEEPAESPGKRWEPVPYEYRGNSLVIRTEGKGNDDGTLIVNFLYDRKFRGTADGRKVDVERSGDRMTVIVPEGSREVRITYTENDFRWGLVIACLTLICVMILFNRDRLYCRIKRHFRG